MTGEEDPLFRGKVPLALPFRLFHGEDVLAGGWWNGRRTVIELYSEQLFQHCPIRDQTVVKLRQVLERNVAVPVLGPQGLQYLDTLSLDGQMGQVMAGGVIIAHLREVDTDDARVVSLDDLEDPADEEM